MPDDTALEQGEQDDFGIPGQGDDGPGAGIRGGDVSPAPTQAPVQVDSAQKVHPHVAILAGLLGKALGVVRSAPGNPNNAFDRGFMAASPQAQQAQQTKQKMAQAQLQNQLDQNSMNIVKLHMAQMQDAITARNLLHADDARQQAILDNASDEYDALDGKGLISEKSDIEGEGMKAYGDALKYAHSQQAKIGAMGPDRFMVFADGKDLAHAHFIVGKINPQDMVQDGEGNRYTVADYMHLNASQRASIGKSAVKDRIKDLTDTYFKPPKEGEIKYGETRDALVAQADQDLKTPGIQGTGLEQAIQQRKTNLQAMKPAFQNAAEERKSEEHQRQLDREANRDKSHEDDAVYAFNPDPNDPKKGEYELTTRGQAAGRQTFKQSAEFDKSLSRAQRIEDVANKTLDYRDTFTHGLTRNDKDAITNFLSEHPSMLTGPGIGQFKVEVGAEGAGLEEVTRDLDQASMSKDAKERLRGFLLAKTTALEMQRIETDSARMSTGGMQLDLGSLARPTDDPETAMAKMDKFMRSLKTFGKVRVKGIPTAQEIEEGRPFDLKKLEDWQNKFNEKKDKERSINEREKEEEKALNPIELMKKIGRAEGFGK